MNVQTLPPKPSIDSSGFALTQLERGDIDALATWITDTGELPLISGEASPLLRPVILESWHHGSLKTQVVRVARRPVGLGMLSQTEATLPPVTAEVCHLIIAPEWRQQYKGSQLVLTLMAEAQRLGLHRLVARVVPENAVAHALFSALRWRPLTPAASWAIDGFIWYTCSLIR